MKHMNDPNLEISSNGNPPSAHHHSSAAGRETQRDSEDDSISSKIFRVVGIIQDVQSYTPHYLAEGLEKVLELLFMIYPVSPPPVKYEERFGAESLPERMKSKAVQPKPDILGNMMKHKGASHDETSSQKAPKDGRISGPDEGNSVTSSRTFEFSGDEIFEWNCPIFHVEEKTRRRALTFMGMKFFSLFGIHDTLKVGMDVIENWLTLVENSYRKTPPYHNSTHAGDVVQAVAYFLNLDGMKTYFDPLDRATCLIAAAIHDVDHPGRTNAFLAQTRHELAMLYNDKAILESHHASFGFKLTLSDPRVNILQSLDNDTFRKVRAQVVDMVLATEMTKHFSHLYNFKEALCKAYPSVDFGTGKTGGNLSMEQFKSNENQAHCRRILIKCADISNPARPLKFAAEWAFRICEEFTLQTEEEKLLGLHPTLPSFESREFSIPEAQVDFIEYFAIDLFQLWHEFSHIPPVWKQLQSNLEFWKQLQSLGVNTINEVRQYFENNV